MTEPWWKFSAIRADIDEPMRRDLRTQRDSDPIETSDVGYNDPRIHNVNGREYWEKSPQAIKDSGSGAYAEVFSSLVGRALGANVPRTIHSPRGNLRHDTEQSVFSENVPGYRPYRDDDEYQQALHSRAGKLLGAVDALVDAPDHQRGRNTGMNANGEPHALDYEGADGFYRPTGVRTTSDFASHYVEPRNIVHDTALNHRTDGVLKDNPLTQRDVARGREALMKLKPFFEKAHWGGGNWEHANLMSRWEELASHAAGRDGEDILPENLPEIRLLSHAAVDEYEVHPDEIGYLKARDFGDTPLRERPWEQSSQAADFDARVREIMDSAQHEGIREPVDIQHGRLHDGTHRWEAARRLGIPLMVRRSSVQKQATPSPDESGLKAAGIAVIAMDTGRILMQQRALNPVTCPCGQGVTWDESNGWQHDDGSTDHDEDDFAGQSVNDLLDGGHDRCPECDGAGEDSEGHECAPCDGSGVLEKTAMPTDVNFLRGLRYEHSVSGDGRHHMIEAYDHDDNCLGGLSWRSGTITGVDVDPAHQRKGLASELLARAREIASHGDGWVDHNWDDMSKDAQGWAAALGEHDPWEDEKEDLLREASAGDELTRGAEPADPDWWRAPGSHPAVQNPENPWVPGSDKQLMRVIDPAALDPKSGVPGRNNALDPFFDLKPDTDQGEPYKAFMGPEHGAMCKECWLGPKHLDVPSSWDHFAQTGHTPLPPPTRYSSVKQAIRKPGLQNPYTGGDEWFHGTRAYPEELSEHGFIDPMYSSSEYFESPDGDLQGHWNQLLGTHFSADHDIAKDFASGMYSSHANDRSEDNNGRGDSQSIVHARIGLHNPKVYRSEHDMDQEAYEDEWNSGNSYAKHLPELESDDEDDRWGLEETWPEASRIHQQYGKRKIPSTSTEGGHPARTLWLNYHPDRLGIASRFRQKLQDAGHDGIVYGNEYERSKNGGKANRSAIVFDPRDIQVSQTHNIYKPCLTEEEGEQQQDRLPGYGQGELPLGFRFSKEAALDYDANEGTWEFPGGKIDPGENAKQAAVREFREEVGQDLPPGVFVGAWLSPGGIVTTATVPGPEPWDPDQRPTWGEEQRHAPAGFRIPKPPIYRAPTDVDPRALDDEHAMHTYNEMQHDPYNPAVQDSYDALERETLAQWKALQDAGLKVDFHDGFGGNRDYPRSKDMMADVNQNGHLWTRHSALDGLSDDHPMARHMGFNVPVMTESGWQQKPAMLNDIFRAVHDVNGHAAGQGHEIVGFGPKGEFNAWLRHRTTYSDAALPALWNETRGQAAQLGPLTAQGIPLSEVPFLEQKAGLVPRHMASRQAMDGVCVTPGRADELATTAAVKKQPLYKGFIYLIQHERDIDLSNREHANPDDPDGDMTEQSAWWEIEHARKNPALRKEVKSAPWAEFELWADKSVRSNRQVQAMVSKLAMGLDKQDQEARAFPQHTPNSVYLRFGDWPESEQSHNYVTEDPEIGVSAYEMDRDGYPLDPDSAMNRGIHHHDDSCADEDDWGYHPCGMEEGEQDPDFTDHTFHMVRDHQIGAAATNNIGSESRAHLVKGDVVGSGHDDEPLLRNVKTVGHWPCDLGKVVPGWKAPEEGESAYEGTWRNGKVDWCEHPDHDFDDDGMEHEAAVKVAMPRDDDFLSSLEYEFSPASDENPQHEVIAREPSGLAAGSVRWWPIGQHDLHGPEDDAQDISRISGISVYKDNLRKGLATELLRNAKARAAEEGARLHHSYSLVWNGPDLVAGLGDRVGGPVLEREDSLVRKQAMPTTQHEPVVRRVIKPGEGRDDEYGTYDEGSRVSDVSLPSGDWIAKNYQHQQMNDHHNYGPDDRAFAKEKAGRMADEEEFASKFAHAISDPDEVPLAPEAIRGTKVTDPGPTAYVRKMHDFEDLEDDWDRDDWVNTLRGKQMGFYHAGIGEGDHIDHHNMGLTGSYQDPDNKTIVSIDHSMSSLPDYADALRNGDLDNQKFTRWHHRYGMTPYERHYLGTTATGWPGLRKSNPLGPGDAERAHAAAETLRPWAESRGIGHWVDALQDRIGRLGKRAGGEETIFPYQMPHERSVQVPQQRTAAVDWWRYEAAVRVNDLEAERHETQRAEKVDPESKYTANSPTIWTMGDGRYLEKSPRERGQNEFLSSLVGRALGADVSKVMLTPRNDIRYGGKGTILTKVEPGYRDVQGMDHYEREQYKNDMVNSLRGKRLAALDTLVNVYDHNNINHGSKPAPSEPTGRAPHGIDYEHSMEDFQSNPWNGNSMYATAHFVDPYISMLKKENPLTRRDVERGRFAIQSLKPIFSAMGKDYEHDHLMDRWEKMGYNAAGKEGEDILPENLPSLSLLARESQPTSMFKHLPAEQGGGVVHAFDTGRGRWVHRTFEAPATATDPYPMALARAHETSLQDNPSGWQSLGYQTGYPRYVLGNPPEKQPRIAV